mgnify:FL=1
MNTKEKFLLQLNNFNSKGLNKINLSAVSDLQEYVNTLENKYRDITTSNVDLKNGYQDYFDSLDRVIMESAFIYGMSDKVEGELLEASDLVDKAQNNIESLISQFDELGIEPPSDVANLISTFFDLQNAIAETEQSFYDMDKIRNEAEDVNNSTSNKQLNF